jgi:putative transposase
MTCWLSAAELKILPGIPTNVANIRLKAERENWQSRPRGGRGGGLEYLVCDRYLTDEFLAAARDKFPERFPVSSGMKKDVLSESSKTEIESFMARAGYDTLKTANLADLKPEPPAPLATLTNEEPKIIKAIAKTEDMAPLSDKESQLIWARQEIVKIWKAHLEQQRLLGIGEVEATSIFCRQVSEGNYPIPEWVRDGLLTKKGKVKLSRSILHVWQSKTAPELAPKHKGKDGFFESRPEYRAVIDALCQEFGAVATRIEFAFESGLIEREFGLAEKPSLSQIRTYVANLKDSNKQLARSWATGDKSILLNAQGSYSRGLLANQKWEIDSTKMDLWLVSPHGETMTRWGLVGCIDVATRRVKLLICPSSKGDAITLLISQCVTDWGLPIAIKTDNGKDYIGREVQGFCRALGIEQVLCTPKQPWEKPHVERMMRSLQHSQPWEMLPWNTGHNVAQQTAKRAKKENDLILGWTASRFQEWLNSWADAYHNELHESLGCSPNERLGAFRADGWIGTKPKNLKENLEFALLQEELVTVNKKGIRFQNRNYIAPELQGRVGEKFGIRIDQDNPNQILVYDSLDLTTAKLICIAIWDMALTAEEQARIAIAKPVVDQALIDHQQAVKKKRKAISLSLQKNPEQLLPERGGVAALQAFQTIDAPTQNLLNQLNVATQIPTRTAEELTEIEAQRLIHLSEIEAKEKAQKRRVQSQQDERDMLWRIVNAWQSQTACDPEELAYVARWYSVDEGEIEGLLFSLDQLTEKRFLIWLKSQKAPIQTTGIL